LRKPLRKPALLCFLGSWREARHDVGRFLPYQVDIPDHVSPMAASLLKGLLEKVIPRRLGYFSSNQVSRT
jgi:hypothetical protein